MISPTSFIDTPEPTSAATTSTSNARSYPVNPAKEHDAELVRRFKAGDEDAFLEIVERYRSKTFAIALSLLRNRADAEEIAQDTFIRAYRGLAQFRGDSSLATWLHRIALNLARNRYWHLFRRCRHLTLSLDCPLGEGSPATFTDLISAPEPTPARQAAVDEFSVMVSACMEKLNVGHREILNLRTRLHRSYDEIAIILQISVGTVKSQISRARERLRELISESYPEFELELPIAQWFEPVRGGTDNVRTTKPLRNGA